MSVNKNTNGSVLIAALIMTLITGSLVGLFLKTVTQEVRNAYRARMAFQAVNIAEAGLEYAIYAINQEDYAAPWSARGDGYYRTEFVHIDKLAQVFGKQRHSARVYFEPDEIAPMAVAEGRIRSLSGMEVSRQIYIELGPRTPFANGVVARDSIKFNGNGIYVDSYISRPTRYRDWDLGQHPYYDDWVANPDNPSFKYSYGQNLDWATQSTNIEANIDDHNEGGTGGNYVDDIKTNVLDGGTVASISILEDILALGNSDIWGRAATAGSDPIILKNGSVRGEDTPNGVKVDPNRVALDFYMNIPELEAPSLGTTETAPSTHSVDGAKLTVWGGNSSYEYQQSELDIGSNEVHIVVGKVLLDVTGSVDINNGQLILAKKGDRIPTWDSTTGDWFPYDQWQVASADAELELHVGGNFSIGGNDGSIANGGDYPDDFLDEVADAFGSSAVIRNNPAIGSPEDLILFGYGSDNPDTAVADDPPFFKLHGSGTFYGAVYAPNSTISLDGSGGAKGQMFGAVVAYSIDFAGGYQFHYDEALAEYENKELRKVTRWLELTDAEERKKMAPMLN
jgi:hypothetical protein